jgi:hypothetical protein
VSETSITHPSLESSFGDLLATALKQGCDTGRHSGRRLDDLLFHEWDEARDGQFASWVQRVMYEDRQPGGPESTKPYPKDHQDLSWPLIIIQAAIYARDPELVAAILEAEIDYELEDIAENDWVDKDGNPAPLPDDEIDDDQRAVMAWPSSWRRVFGTDDPEPPPA